MEEDRDVHILIPGSVPTDLDSSPSTVDEPEKVVSVEISSLPLKPVIFDAVKEASQVDDWYRCVGGDKYYLFYLLHRNGGRKRDAYDEYRNNRTGSDHDSLQAAVRIMSPAPVDAQIEITNPPLVYKKYYDIATEDPENVIVHGKWMEWMEYQSGLAAGSPVPIDDSNVPDVIDAFPEILSMMDETGATDGYMCFYALHSAKMNSTKATLPTDTSESYRDYYILVMKLRAGSVTLADEHHPMFWRALVNEKSLNDADETPSVGPVEGNPAVQELLAMLSDLPSTPPSPLMCFYVLHQSQFDMNVAHDRFVSGGTEDASIDLAEYYTLAEKLRLGLVTDEDQYLSTFRAVVRGAFSHKPQQQSHQKPGKPSRRQRKQDRATALVKEYNPYYQRPTTYNYVEDPHRWDNHPAVVPPKDGSCPFNNLDDDSLRCVTGYLGPTDLCRLSQVNQNLRSIAGDDVAWKANYQIEYGFGEASYSEVNLVKDWKNVYMIRAVYGRSHPGFVRQRHIIIRMFVRFFLFLFLCLLFPICLPFMLLGTYRGVRMIKQIKEGFQCDRRMMQLTLRLSIQVFCLFLYDICLVVPLICQFLPLITFWRYPASAYFAWHHSDDSYSARKAYHFSAAAKRMLAQTDEVQFTSMMREEFRAIAIYGANGLATLADLFMLVAIVPFILITCFRIPTWIKELHALGYEKLVQPSYSYNVTYSNAKQAWCCASALPELFGDLVLNVLSILLIVICAPFTLILFTHRSLQLISSFSHASDIQEVGLKFLQIALFIFFDMIFGALPFFAWIIVLVTIYRVPLIYQYSAENNNCSMLVLGFYTILQALLVVVDFTLVPLFSLVTLLCIHRIPDTLRELNACSYKELTSDMKMLRIVAKGAFDSIICSGCAVVGVVFLTIFLSAILGPIGLMLLFSCTHHTVYLIRRLKHVGGIGDLAVIISSVFFGFVVDALIAGFAFICWFMLVATVYRLPKTISAICESADESGNSFTFYPSKAVMVQWLLLWADLFGIIFLFPILLFTCTRLPSFAKTLHANTYWENMETTITGTMISEIKQLGCCTGACSRLIRSFFGLICPFIGIFIASLFLVPMFVVILFSCNHYSIFLIMRLRHVSGFGGFALTVCSLFFGFLIETTISVGLNYVCFYLVLVSIYRFPALLSGLNEAAESRSSHCNFFPLGTVFKHGILFILDLLSSIFVFVPILITCQRMPYLVRRLRASTYADVMNFTVGTVFCQEFREIGYSTDRTDAQEAANRVVGYNQP